MEEADGEENDEDEEDEEAKIQHLKEVSTNSWILHGAVESSKHVNFEIYCVKYESWYRLHGCKELWACFGTGD